MNRRAFLARIGLALGSGFCLAAGAAGTARAADKKARKKSLDQRKSDGNRDGKNNVDGALWVLTANDSKSGRELTFRYRASNGVLYDAGSGRAIGDTKPVAKGLARVTFSGDSPFPGSFEIKLRRVNHWRGQKSDSTGDWNVSLDCVDR
jgi:hypothetical protein